LTVLTYAIGAVALFVLVPSLVFLVECVASLFPLRPRLQELPPGATTVVLVPAHDESASIGGTVAALKGELRKGDRLIVVADNCTDDTAERAIAAGATAIRRQDPEHRGKGYALRFGVEWLESNPPTVVVVVDADCRLQPGSIHLLAAQALALGRPVQAEYTFVPPTRTPLSMVSMLALLVRNRVRPRGLRRLGLPCQLTGSGMAFPWPLLRDAPPLHAHLVEDLLLGVELARAGAPPFHSIEAQVTSELPTSTSAAMQQRKRWEHGQLGTLLRQGPRLVLAGISRLDLGLVALGADLMVPPLALLVGLSVLTTGAAAALVMAEGSVLPLWFASAALTAVAIAVGLAWVRYGRKSVPFRYLLVAPLYLLWKVPLYLSFSLGRRERRWRRTER
jgi:cellulose synthase/poly-beta-1,6-N-acetylglucosamine synthase-like glycosyltransferase